MSGDDKKPILNPKKPSNLIANSEMRKVKGKSVGIYTFATICVMCGRKAARKKFTIIKHHVYCIIMKTNRNKKLDKKEQLNEKIAVVLPHLHFDLLLPVILEKINSLTIICVYDGKKPEIDGLIYIPGGGSFARSSNIGIAYAQSLGFSYVCLINDDVVLSFRDIEKLFMHMDVKTGLVSPCIFEKQKSYQGIFVSHNTGYLRCLSSKLYPTVHKYFEDQIYHLGSCILFRSSFRFDERFLHGMEDIEFSRRIRNIQNTRFVSDVLIFHKGASSIPTYSYESEKKALQGKFLLFEEMQYRLLLWSCIHVLFQGGRKKERFLAIKDAYFWRKNQKLRR